jgi:hypothetical protein
VVLCCWSSDHIERMARRDAIRDDPQSASMFNCQLHHTCAHTCQIFSRAPPPRNDFGFDTLGWKHGGDALFWGTTTTIEGPLSHGKPQRKQVGFLSRGRPTSGSRRHSDEDHIAPPPEGVISTKTVVEVASHAMPGQYAHSDFSMIELEDKSERARSPVSGSTTR